MNGDETFPNALTYATSVDVVSGDATNTIPTLEYVNTVATSGAANATYDVTGLVHLATATELTIGTATSSAGEYLVVPSELVHSSSTARYMIALTRASGKFDQGFIDLTEPFTFSGSLIISATTTLATTTISDLTVSGTSTLTGTTTFSAIPTLPASDPTTDNQAVRKSYVDDFQKFSVSTTTSKALDTYYQNGDSWKIVTISVTHDCGGAGHSTNISYGIGVSTTTLFQVARTGCSEVPGSAQVSSTFFVPPTYYYKASKSVTGGQTVTLITWTETN